VGVFVDAPPSTIIHAVETYGLRLVQLHGSETPGYCEALRKMLPGDSEKPGDFKVIKVFSVRDRFDFNLLQPYEQVCDYFLFDTKGELPGGNGFVFDWRLLKEYPSKTPFFLSGGIGPEELPQLRAFLQGPEARLCHAIDVNSRFELEPGYKITETLEPFIREIQSA
jgi:phosphoribosylanthranilate isomerase